MYQKNFLNNKQCFHITNKYNHEEENSKISQESNANSLSIRFAALMAFDFKQSPSKFLRTKN